jgi:glyoxylate/hydroxypyruvate reductase A
MTRIAICVPGYRPDAWIKALSLALPEATIEGYDPAAADGVDYAVVWAPGTDLFRTQTRLKAVFNLGAGVDALLKTDNLPPDLAVVRLGDAGMSVQMAEYVCQSVARFARDLKRDETNMSEGRWHQRMPRRRDQYPIGVMGLGAIGARVAEALAWFEYPVFGWSRNPRSLADITTFSGTDGMDAFLRSCRVLVCALPLTADTEGILCRANLEKLKPDAYLISVGRGAHLVEEDLMALIDAGHLSGATLDVFRVEPLPAEHPFHGYPSITMTPHVSAVTIVEVSAEQIAGKIRRLESGQSIDGVVDRSKGY